jgi:hypothetical protein
MDHSAAASAATQQADSSRRFFFTSSHLPGTRKNFHSFHSGATTSPTSDMATMVWPITSSPYGLKNCVRNHKIENRTTQR